MIDEMSDKTPGVGMSAAERMRESCWNSAMEFRAAFQHDALQATRSFDREGYTKATLQARTASTIASAISTLPLRPDPICDALVEALHLIRILQFERCLAVIPLPVQSVDHMALRRIDAALTLAGETP